MDYRCGVVERIWVVSERSGEEGRSLKWHVRRMMKNYELEVVYDWSLGKE
jgi:hypothetical protein